MEHEKLLKIKQESSTNAKIQLLSEYLKEDTFKTIIKLMYNDDMHFKVNRLNPFILQTSGLLCKKPTTSDLLKFLNKLANQRGATNSDKRELSRLASIDKETYQLVTRIINKDAKSGFGGKTINKACKNLLFLMPYCRCSTAKKKMSVIDYETGAIGQEKADGMFVNIIIGNRKADSLIRSRNGNIVHQMEHLHEFFYHMPRTYRNTVYMGELLIMIDGKILPRKTGNGILNSCLQNAAPHDKANHAIIKLWDAVPQKDFWAGYSKIGYKYRLTRVSKFIAAMNHSPLCSKIKSKMLYSLEEAQKFYKQLRLDGKEGAIVKNIHAKWKDHTSPDCVKLKNVMDVELRIVSWKHGKEDTRFRNCMGSVQLESDDGLISVSVSGFKDFEHFDIDWDERIGKVATLECESLTSDKSRPGYYSLYLPANLELRPDRSDTDTLQDLKNR